MTYTIVKDGKDWKEYSTAEQCVAEILVKGWTLPVERFGVVWVKGIEIRENVDGVARRTGQNDGIPSD